MRLENKSTLIAATGVQIQGAFGMKANATAFSVLSSKLYSDKISAVLREYGCNAFDSHIAAGKRDTPFLVKLPTALDDSFFIRDYGVGLDEKETAHLFCTYFSSNKNDSDDMTGGFGLGSKSAFAYTDRFTVRAAKDGVVRVFMCYFDAAGTPAIAKVAEEPSPDWPSGVEVGFAVPAGDCLEFARKAQRIYGAFETIPLVIGAVVEASVVPMEYGWNRFAVADTSEYRRDKIFVRMGNVLYPISLGDVDYSMRYHNPFMGYLNESRVVFDMPIGSLDVAVSRESLEYTDKTKETLIARFTTAKEELSAVIGKLIATMDLKSIDGLTKAKQLLTSTGLSSGLIQSVWVNPDDVPSIKEILSGVMCPFHLTEHAIFATHVYLRNGKTHALCSSRYTRPDGASYIRGMAASQVTIRLGETTAFLLDDFPLEDPADTVSRQTMRRARALVRERKAEHVYIIASQDGSTLAAAEAELQTAQRFAYGWVNASSVAKPKAKPRDKSAPKTNRLPWQGRTIPVMPLELSILNKDRRSWTNPEPVLQGTLPAATTFYVTRDCTYGNHSIKERVLTGHSPVECISQFSRAHKENLTCAIPLPTHLIIATKTEMKKARMEEAPFRPLAAWADEANAVYLALPALAHKPDRVRANWPPLVRAYENSNTTRKLLAHQALDTSLWKVLKPRLARTDLGNYLQEISDLPEQIKTEDTNFQAQFYRFLTEHGVRIPQMLHDVVYPDEDARLWQEKNMPLLDFVCIPTEDLELEPAIVSKIVELFDLMIPNQAPLLAAVA